MATQNNPRTMTRAEQKMLTQQRVIDATLDIIAREGLSGVTMAKIAATAGFSKGTGNFHFQSKKQLLRETLRSLQGEFEATWRAAVAEAGPSPVRQLCALIQSMLQPPIANPDRLSVWFAFWGENPSRSTYREICATPDREWQAAIEKLLQQIAGDNMSQLGMSLRTITFSLTAMMTGCWLESILSPDFFELKDAIRACYAYLASFFPEFVTLSDNI